MQVCFLFAFLSENKTDRVKWDSIRNDGGSDGGIGGGGARSHNFAKCEIIID